MRRHPPGGGRRSPPRRPAASRTPVPIVPALGAVAAAALALVAWALAEGGPPVRYVEVPSLELAVDPAAAPPPATGAAAAAGTARPTAPARVAVVVTELGLAAVAFDRALTLPAVTGLVVSPYAPALPDLIARARAAGHEPWIEAPLAAAEQGLVDRGPMTLAPGQPAAEIRERVAWLLGGGAEATGLAAEAGAFAGEPLALTPVLAPLAPARLAFIELGGRSLAPAAAAAGLRFAATAGPIDAVPEAAAIDGALERHAARAGEAGSAMIWGRALPVTLERLGAWMRRLEAAEVELVAPSLLALVPPDGAAVAP